jgi:hypothetical protein
MGGCHQLASQLARVLKRHWNLNLNGAWGPTFNGGKDSQFYAITPCFCGRGLRRYYSVWRFALISKIAHAL